MSSVSGASANSSNFYQILSAASTDRKGGCSSLQPLSNEFDWASASSSSEGSGSSDSVQNGEFITVLRKQIEAAVASVLEKFDLNSTEASAETNAASTDEVVAGGTSVDPRELFEQIHAAVDDVLKENGIEPPARPEPGNGGPTPFGTLGDDGSSPMIDFLAQNGVDPEEFRQNVLTALRQGAGGEIDFAEIFKNFRAGQSVDILA